MFGQQLGALSIFIIVQISLRFSALHFTNIHLMQINFSFVILTLMITSTFTLTSTDYS